MRWTVLQYPTVAAVSWVVFWVFADKRRLHELFVYGAFMSAVSLFVMLVETPFDWWDFLDLGPVAEVMVEAFVSISLYGVEWMLLAQYLTRPTKRFIWWAVAVLCVALLNTNGEWLLLRAGMVKYDSGWNLWWTYASYVGPFALAAVHAWAYQKYVRSRD